MRLLRFENAEKFCKTRVSGFADQLIHVDFNVGDFDLVLEKALAAGAECEQIHKVPGFPPVAFCSDPFGHGFCIIGKRE